MKNNPDIEVAGDFLHAAHLLVTGERADQHGEKSQTHDQIASMWNAYLRTTSGTIKGKDVACMMALLKIVRMGNGEYSDDDAIDACGYLAIAGELAKPVEESTVQQFPAMYGGAIG